MQLGVPQLIYLGLLFLKWGITITRYGEPKRDRYDMIDLLAPLVGLGLLYWGGFFGGGVQ